MSKYPRYEAQLARDIKHHERRVEWLRSLPKLDSDLTRLLYQSEEGLKNPHVLYNSCGPDCDCATP